MSDLQEPLISQPTSTSDTLSKWDKKIIKMADHEDSGQCGYVSFGCYTCFIIIMAIAAPIKITTSTAYHRYIIAYMVMLAFWCSVLLAFNLVEAYQSYYGVFYNPSAAYKSYFIRSILFITCIAFGITNLGICTATDECPRKFIIPAQPTWFFLLFYAEFTGSRAFMHLSDIFRVMST